jgi:hypothetical protein
MSSRKNIQVSTTFKSIEVYVVKVIFYFYKNVMKYLIKSTLKKLIPVCFILTTA